MGNDYKQEEIERILKKFYSIIVQPDFSFQENEAFGLKHILDDIQDFLVVANIIFEYKKKIQELRGRIKNNEKNLRQKDETITNLNNEKNKTVGELRDELAKVRSELEKKEQALQEATRNTLETSTSTDQYTGSQFNGDTFDIYCTFFDKITSLKLPTNKLKEIHQILSLLFAPSCNQRNEYEEKKKTISQETCSTLELMEEVYNLLKNAMASYNLIDDWFLLTINEDSIQQMSENDFQLDKLIQDKKTKPSNQITMKDNWFHYDDKENQTRRRGAQPVFVSSILFEGLAVHFRNNEEYTIIIPPLMFSISDTTKENISTSYNMVSDEFGSKEVRPDTSNEKNGIEDSTKTDQLEPKEERPDTTNSGT